MVASNPLVFFFPLFAFLTTVTSGQAIPTTCPAGETLLYTTTWETSDSYAGVSLEPSPSNTSTTASGSTYAGPICLLNDQGFDLAFTGLPAVDSLTLYWQILFLGSWDGNEATFGEQLVISEGSDFSGNVAQTFVTSVASGNGNDQCAPNSFPCGAAAEQSQDADPPFYHAFEQGFQMLLRTETVNSRVDTGMYLWRLSGQDIEPGCDNEPAGVRHLRLCGALTPGSDGSADLDEDDDVDNGSTDNVGSSQVFGLDPIQMLAVGVGCGVLCCSLLFFAARDGSRVRVPILSSRSSSVPVVSVAPKSAHVATTPALSKPRHKSPSKGGRRRSHSGKLKSNSKRKSSKQRPPSIKKQRPPSVDSMATVSTQATGITGGTKGFYKEPTGEKRKSMNKHKSAAPSAAVSSVGFYKDPAGEYTAIPIGQYTGVRASQATGISTTSSKAPFLPSEGEL